MKENKWEGVERWREKGWKDGERERQRQSAGDIPSGRLMQTLGDATELPPRIQFALMISNILWINHGLVHPLLGTLFASSSLCTRGQEHEVCFKIKV